MALRTGPMIEGVVSPTASQTTRTNALQSAATPDRYGTFQYLGTKTAFDSGANTAQAAGAGQLAAAIGTNSGLPDFGSQAYNSSLVAAGWQRQADGSFVNPNTGMVTYDGGRTASPGGTVAPQGPGGGGATGVTGPSGPSGVQNPSGPGAPGDLRGASIAAIEGQINALTAQYGLDLESIAALGGEIGAQARFLLAQLNQDQEYAQEGLTGNLVGRGIYRSGITARDTGRLQNKFAQSRAQVEMNKGSQLRQLAERAGIAKAGLARGKADVISEIDRGNLSAEIRQALLDELNSLRPEDIQRALTSNALPTAGSGLGLAVQ